MIFHVHDKTGNITKFQQAAPPKLEMYRGHLGYRFIRQKSWFNCEYYTVENIPTKADRRARERY